MKTSQFENVLALAGALIVLIGVSAAATSALADETGISAKEQETAAAESSRAISDSANQATTSAIDEAIKTVRLDNRLDLDIRLLDRTSAIVSEL